MQDQDIIHVKIILSMSSKAEELSSIGWVIRRIALSESPALLRLFYMIVNSLIFFLYFSTLFSFGNSIWIGSLYCAVRTAFVFIFSQISYFIYSFGTYMFFVEYIFHSFLSFLDKLQYYLCLEVVSIIGEYFVCVRVCVYVDERNQGEEREADFQGRVST